jgi:hypothetical protein
MFVARSGLDADEGLRLLSELVIVESGFWKEIRFRIERDVVRKVVPDAPANSSHKGAVVAASAKQPVFKIDQIDGCELRA